MMNSGRAAPAHPVGARSPTTVGVMTCVGIAVIVAITLWNHGDAFSGLFAKIQSWLSPAPPAAIAVLPKPAITTAARKNVFVPPAPLGNDASVSKTPLALVLAGTMPGRNAHEGYAFIGITKESPQTYGAGALLSNGARLAEIHEKYVLLTKGDRSAKLYLQDAKGGTTDSTLTALLDVGGVAEPTPAVANSSEPLTDYIRPSPVYDGETLVGYEVYPSKDSAIFRKLGLQPGDLLLSINGEPLIEPTQAIESMRQIVQGVAVTAQVKRKGAIESLALDGSVIQQSQERAQLASVSP